MRVKSLATALIENILRNLLPWHQKKQSIYTKLRHTHLYFNFFLFLKINILQVTKYNSQNLIMYMELVHCLLHRELHDFNKMIHSKDRKGNQC